MIVCQDVSDPLNIGSLFRLADALGISAIYCCGQSPVPPNRRIAKTARSTHQWVPYHYRSTTTETLEELRIAGYTLIGLEITDQSKSLTESDFTTHQPLALIIGAESKGLLPETLALLDLAVHIPMYGRNTSMNVVQACGIALYEITRQLGTTGHWY
ncbi:MAG: TrmH family RNA methyltransferase [Saprospiraceae bacterium]|nr:TrmH family RNA methyltransferase [Lewinella sp.]